MKPLISIIVPNYNHAIFLEERLRSIFNQTFQDFEVFILDDASTDNSLQIINLYRDHPKISQIIINDANSGSPFKQWIKGIELAKGNYIWIAESDDVADEFFLEHTFNFAESKDDLGLVYVTSNVIDGKSLLQDKLLKPHLKTTGFTINSLEEISYFLIKKFSVHNVSSVLFKSHVLKTLDFSKLALFKNSGDRYTYIQIALKKRIYFLDQKLNFHRSHNFNTTKKNVRNFIIYYDRLLIIEDLIPLFSGNKLASSNLKEFYFKQIFCCSEMFFIYRTRTINKKMFHYKLMDLRTYLEMMFLSFLIPASKRKLPHRVREYYKQKMKERYLNF